MFDFFRATCKQSDVMRSKNEENEAYLSEIEVGFFIMEEWSSSFFILLCYFFVYCCLNDFHADYWTSI